MNGQTEGRTEGRIDELRDARMQRRSKSIEERWMEEKWKGSYVARML